MTRHDKDDTKRHTTRTFYALPHPSSFVGSATQDRAYSLLSRLPFLPCAHVLDRSWLTQSATREISLYAELQQTVIPEAMTDGTRKTMGFARPRTNSRKGHGKPIQWRNVFQALLGIQRLSPKVELCGQGGEKLENDRKEAIFTYVLHIP
ncbi:predicted protein [Coccidioides posadasii str. Silveira]|uniref:Predicted protein n=1 Tax=Coccidioides posadasii (strain RMSCC 757 / Silveira) TaxID=443226 RepID=E9D1I9_COCPS|nr:predicted protein [Coccidioides posadasii str. Silveira]